VGIEPPNDRILKNVKKKETIEDITRGCKVLAEAGIPVQAQFMIGNPGDTFKTVKESMDFAKRAGFANCAFYLALPYPKTELWDYAQRHGRFLKSDYTRFHHFSGEPVFETPEFSADERTRAYLMGRRLSTRSKLRQELKTKLSRLRRLDFEDIDPKRALKAAVRLNKYCLDFVLRREEKV
jgi:anaerobic magnesium-protoporphyrin IX monomethyl ester cyclase